jgi:IS30 family transposase
VKIPRGKVVRADTDLTAYTQLELDAIARELNGRPRQTLRWMKPYEVFARTVATIG